jgi:hypothetical protein
MYLALILTMCSPQWYSLGIGTPGSVMCSRKASATASLLHMQTHIHVRARTNHVFSAVAKKERVRQTF